MAELDYNIYKDINLALFRDVPRTTRYIIAAEDAPFNLYSIKLKKPIKKPDFITDEEFNKINPNILRFITCETHGILLLKLSDVESHFKKFHLNTYNKIDPEEKAVLYKIFTSKPLSPYYIFYISNLIPPNIIYLPELSLIKGFKCLKCDFLTGSRKNIKLHLNKSHFIKNKPGDRITNYFISDFPLSLFNKTNTSSYFIPLLPTIDLINKSKDKDNIDLEEEEEEEEIYNSEEIESKLFLYFFI